MAENNRTLEIYSEDGNSSERLLSDLFCKPTVGAASVIRDINPNQGLNINHAVDRLEAQTEEIKKGNLETIEGMLWQQAITLRDLTTRQVYK